MKPLLEVKGLKKHFPIHGGVLYRKVADVKAVDGVDLKILPGETLGVVGESGCGKSTVGRTIIRLYDPSAGTVEFDGQDLASLGAADLKLARRHLQMVFQDPYESLNARHTIGRILEEPFIVHKVGTVAERREAVEALLHRVGLPKSARDKYPHEFSGGQRQRIGIARAIALEPKLVICDEPVSALDVSIQSQVLNLLVELQAEMKLAYLFIAHDLAVVKHVSDRIAVMYLGRVVETAPAEDLYRDAQHPYTRALISAIPVPDPTQRRQRQVLQGEVPSPMAPPAGCHFHTRCPFAKDECRQKTPELASHKGIDDEHLVACHFAGNLEQGG